MEGLNILSKSQILEQSYGINILLVLALVALLFLGFYLAIYCEHKIIKGMGIVFACFSFVSIMILIEAPVKHDTGKYEYKVIISDDIGLIEFNEKYEIVKKDGELYTIKDR